MADHAPGVKGKRGGPQPGSGRKAGSPNVRKRISPEEARKFGELPLERMLKRMNDKTVNDDIRDDLAKAAAPYIHARLSTQTLQGEVATPITHVHDFSQLSREERDALRELLGRATSAIAEPPEDSGSTDEGGLPGQSD